MEPLYLALALALALVLVVAGAWLETKWRALRERRKARDAAKRGIQGERDAEKLIKKLGYKVVTRHPPAGYGMVIDGEPMGVQLQADYLLEQNGKRVIAEVKTGKASKIEHAETRRQMLEYQLAFGVDTLLLIDMDAKQVRTVRFPLPKQKAAVVKAPAKKSSMALRWAAIAVVTLAAVWLLRSVRAPEEPEAAPQH